MPLPSRNIFRLLWIGILLSISGTNTPKAASLSPMVAVEPPVIPFGYEDRKSTRLNSSHGYISYAVFCLKKNTCQDVVHRVGAAEGRRLRTDQIKLVEAVEKFSFFLIPRPPRNHVVLPGQRTSCS